MAVAWLPVLAHPLLLCSEEAEMRVCLCPEAGPGDLHSSSVSASILMVDECHHPRAESASSLS